MVGFHLTKQTLELGLITQSKPTMFGTPASYWKFILRTVHTFLGASAPEASSTFILSAEKVMMEEKESRQRSDCAVLPGKMSQMTQQLISAAQ